MWIVMFTYLQHVDPTVPCYRRKEWTFLRGALSTVDRPFFGWIGRFFFHNACHNHVSLLFVCLSMPTELRLTNRSRIIYSHPFHSVRLVDRVDSQVHSLLDNQPLVTECIKKVLGDDYNYDSTVRATGLVLLY